MSAVLNSLLLVALMTSVCFVLLPRWEARGILLTGRDLTFAAVAGGGAAFLAWGQLAPAMAAFAVFVTAGVVAAIADLRTHLVPSGAMWVGVVVGVSQLVLATLTEGPWMVVSGALLAMLALLFALVSVMTGGGIGGGDLRLLLMAAATLWWVPPVLLLAAVLVAMVAGMIHTIVARARAPLAPYLVTALALAATVFVLTGG
jgi:Flp pilus assembly protein protease CpaA